MAKTEAKKADLEYTVAKLVAQVDSDAATSAKRKEEVKELQSRLAAMAKYQANMDSIRDSLWQRICIHPRLATCKA